MKWWTERKLAQYEYAYSELCGDVGDSNFQRENLFNRAAIIPSVYWTDPCPYDTLNHKMIGSAHLLSLSGSVSLSLCCCSDVIMKVGRFVMCLNTLLVPSPEHPVCLKCNYANASGVQGQCGTLHVWHLCPCCLLSEIMEHTSISSWLFKDCGVSLVQTQISWKMFTILKCFVGKEEWADGEIRLHLTMYSLIGVAFMLRILGICLLHSLKV